MPAQFPGDAIAALTGKLARDYAVMPLRVDAVSIDLLAADPFNTHIVDDLTFALGRSVRLILSDPDKIDVQIRQHFGEDEASLDELLQEISAADFNQDESKLSDHDIETMAEQTPIIRFVNLVIGQAIRDKASDIHFEPFEHEFKIRYRIDGALYEMAPPPKQLALPITSRLKVLANLNIAVNNSKRINSYASGNLGVWMDVGKRLNHVLQVAKGRKKPVSINQALFLNNLRHHFGLGNGFAVHKSNTTHVANTSADGRNKFKFKDEGVARTNFLLEPHIVYFHEIGQVIFRIRNRVQYQNSTHLRHGFNNQNARHNRISGEVPAEEILVHGNVFQTDNMIFAHFQNLINEQERLTMR
jgi:hypothetical protein